MMVFGVFVSLWCNSASAETREERKLRIERKYLSESQEVVDLAVILPEEPEEDLFAGLAAFADRSDSEGEGGTLAHMRPVAVRSRRSVMSFEGGLFPESDEEGELDAEALRQQKYDENWERIQESFLARETRDSGSVSGSRSVYGSSSSYSSGSTYSSSSYTYGSSAGSSSAYGYSSYEDRYSYGSLSGGADSGFSGSRDLSDLNSTLPSLSSRSRESEGSGSTGLSSGSSESAWSISSASDSSLSETTYETPSDRSSSRSPSRDFITPSRGQTEFWDSYDSDFMDLNHD